MLKEQHKAHIYFLILLDILTIIISDALAIYIRFRSGIFNDTQAMELPIMDYYRILLWIIPICIITYNTAGLYKEFFNLERPRSFAKLITCNILVALLLMSLTFILKSGWNYSRYVLSFAIALNILISVILRSIFCIFLRKWYRKGNYSTNILVIGTDTLAVDYINSIKRYLDFGYKVKAILAISSDVVDRTICGIPVVGTLEDFEKIYTEVPFDEVVIALQLDQVYLGKKIIQMCDKEGIRIKFIPAYCEFIKTDMNIENVSGLPLLVIREVPLDIIFNRISKRIFDIIFSLSAIIITLPIMFFISIGIKLTSPGPIFFKQERVGIKNKTFAMLKFRSMKVQKESEEVSKWTTKNDPRKTKLGAFIRKTSLDELPQFFNVFLGHMSVVGPRPERPYWVQQFKENIPDYMLRHYVKSGITGWAQVNGWRGDTSIDERIKCDNYYIQNWSLFFDIKIIFLTVFKGFKNNNAY